MASKNRRGMNLERRRSLAGIMFVLPWIIGFVGMFIRPLVSSMLYSVSNTKISPRGMILEYIGFVNFHKAFFSDLYYSQYLFGEVSGMVSNAVIILAFSLMMAVIISGEFKGRTLIRTVFFLPVICGSGVVLSILNGDVMSNSIISGERASMLFQTKGIDSLLLNMGLNYDLVTTLTGIVDGIFNLTWKSGLQILLFLSGLLSVSPSLYESAKIEGATRWEVFWKITFPLVTPILILNVVYTIIDGFTDYSNKVMRYILNFARELNFSYSAALSWIYFIIIMAIIGITYAIINKRVVYTVE